MIDYANTLLSLIQSAACSARIPAGTDRGKCVHITQLTHYQIVYLDFCVSRSRSQFAKRTFHCEQRYKLKLPYKNFLLI